MHTRAFALPALGRRRLRRTRSPRTRALHGLSDPADLREKRQVVRAVRREALLHVDIGHLHAAALANGPRRRLVERHKQTRVKQTEDHLVHTQEEALQHNRLVGITRCVSR